MATRKQKQEKEQSVESGGFDAADFTSDLIKSLNKEKGDRIAYNLAVDISPTSVDRWISTGSRLLDYIISNRTKGGLPEGRIIEIFGPPSIGKSHLALQIAKSTQRAGGIVVYIDTENATSIENLYALGVDVNKKFVYIETSCTEEVFSVAEKTILKAKAANKDLPVTIIWDSVAATAPKAELDGDYDQNSVGLQARTISKGMRKITGVIGNQKVTFVILNQIRTKIGVMYGDPTTTPGGMAIPFHSSVRIKLGAGQHIKDKDGSIIGIDVSAKTIKNKVAPPFRGCEFQIHFGKGIKEHEQIFDVLNQFGEATIDDKIISCGGNSQWKLFTVTDATSGEVLIEKKFNKSGFDKILDDPQYAPYLDKLLEAAMVKKFSTQDPDIDAESYSEVQALADELSDGGSIEGLEDLSV